MLRLALLLMTTTAAAAAERPNIIFILADDLGVNDLGCYGRLEHKTPNLDRLAAAGTLFTQAYAACPVCSPTRAALLTGQHPARLHLTTFLPGRPDAASQKLLQPMMKQALPLAEVTLAERLKAAGYATACFGKWHLGHSPDEQGFDIVHAGKANTVPGVSEGGKGEYDLTNHAIDFVTAHKDKPFFLYLAHNTPHIPLAGKRDLVEKYSHTFNPTYAAVISSLDDSIGQLLSTLDRHKLAEKTLVIFTSDNGGLHVPEGGGDAPTHNTPARAGKGFLYEGGIRVPLIVRHPGVVPAARTTSVPVISTDWTPTLLAVAEITTPDAFDGIDIGDALRGCDVEVERNFYWHLPHYTNQGSRPSAAIRSGSFKLIEHSEDRSIELYNVVNDATERNNLAGTYVGMAESLREKLADWRKLVGAQETVPNPAFNAAAHQALYIDVDVSRVRFETTAKKLSDPLREWRGKMNAAVKK